jgi:putative transposase
MALLARACEHIAMRILAWCLMPNHFHLVLRPYADLDLGRWMHRVMTAHVKRHQSRYETVGRIWQGRFKALPIQEDGHLVTVLRYVERNPRRAGLVDSAEAWPWSSLRSRRASGGLLCPSPVRLPENWDAFVNGTSGDEQLDSIRLAIHRGRPFGDPVWMEQTAERLGLESSLKPIGRTPGRSSRSPRLTALTER